MVLENPPNLILPIIFLPNVHGVKHEVKYSNGTIEIPMLEERDCRDKAIALRVELIY